MILDKNTMFADGLAHNGTPTVIDMESVRPGPGTPIKIFVQGSSTLAGCTGVVITDGATDAAADAHTSHTCTLAGKTIELELPSDIARYVKLDLIGTTTAGTWSAGVVLPGIQTAG
jgi:hypothetical protein